jgi:hypothetical protein
MPRYPFLDSEAQKHSLVGRRVLAGVIKTPGTIVGVQSDGSICVEYDNDREQRIANPNPFSSGSMAVVAPEHVEFVD